MIPKSQSQIFMIEICGCEERRMRAHQAGWKKPDSNSTYKSDTVVTVSVVFASERDLSLAIGGVDGTF